MTQEEARLTLQENFGLLSFEYPGRITEAIKIALEVLSQPSPPSNLDEAAEKYACTEYPPYYEMPDDNWKERAGYMKGFKAVVEWEAEQARKEE